MMNDFHGAERHRNVPALQVESAQAVGRQFQDSMYLTNMLELVVVLGIHEVCIFQLTADLIKLVVEGKFCYR